MDSRTRVPGVWLWFTIPIALLLLIASGAGVSVEGLYRDAPYFVAQARGQDLVNLILVIPALVVTAILAHRGSLRAHAVWLGVLIYLVYSYVIATFSVRFNSLFLAYVALLGCALYTLIGSLVTTGLVASQIWLAEKNPVKFAGIYLGVLAVLFYSLWLSEIIPALLTGQVPQSILDNGTPTNAVHVLDMAWILPAFGITAVCLWRRQPVGYTLAGAMLSYIVLLISAILGMVVFMIRDGQSIPVPQVIIFGTLFAVSLGTLIGYLRGLGQISSIRPGT